MKQGGMGWWLHSGLVLVFALLALCLLLGGAWLAWLGGSLYYLAAGGWLLLVSVLLGRRSALADLGYAAFLLATLAWTLAEVEADFWLLLPRMALWFLLGLWLALPALQCRLPPLFGARSLLWLGLLAMGGVTLATLWPEASVAPVVLSGASAPGGLNSTATDWPAYGGDAGGQRYSALQQITAQNVEGLSLAWSLRTGDLPGAQDPHETTFENTPLKVNGLLYVCTPHSRILAVEPESGRERWRFDPQLRGDAQKGFADWPHMTCRGLAYHADEVQASASGKPLAACARRLFLPTADARLIAVDADDGKPCAGFGEGGSVDLSRGLPGYRPGQYFSTSPPLVAGDRVVVGGQETDAIGSGVVRAYDVHDGHLVWNWDGGADTRPLPPGANYGRGSPNVWSVMSVDERLGLLYLPMGNPRPDSWAGRRSAVAERYGSGVTALEIASGQPRWTFQAVHHDLWDLDAPAQPSLIDLRRGADVRPALVLPTKAGSLFVLDRRNGQPLVPVIERRVPHEALPGDHTAPTQPSSLIDFTPPTLQEADMWGLTPLDQLACRIRFRSLHYLGPYTASHNAGALHYPGNSGVFNWGGVALDPVHQVAFLNPSYMAFESHRVPGDGRTPFGVRSEPFLSALGLPCQAPPWGEVAALDLASNHVLWRHRNGTVRDLSPLPLLLTPGVPSLGGAVVTAGGVAFMAAALDQYLRAYDLSDGRELWRARLPAGGQATPMTYQGRDGRQYVVIAAGGHGELGTRQGDWVLAFALPSH